MAGLLEQNSLSDLKLLSANVLTKTRRPHVNWGDLYFDLYYVAAAYQLSHAFKDEPTAEGLMYFFATFLPVSMIWYEKLLYDARYQPDDNLFHRSMEILHLCVLGTSVQHIQPVEIMRDTVHSPNTFIFCLALLLDALWLIHLYDDVRQNVEGGPEAKCDAANELRRKPISVACYALATAVSGWDYFFVAATTHSEDGGGGGNVWPAYFLLAAFVGETMVFTWINYFVLIPRRVQSHKQVMVPVNIEFVIHRFGEWIMLMLGESVLSLLTLEQKGDAKKGEDSVRYAVSFYSGLLTVTFFQYLFFRSKFTCYRLLVGMWRL